MTTTQIVETSVNVNISVFVVVLYWYRCSSVMLYTINKTNNNSPIQDYNYPEDHAPPTYEMTTRFKPFTAM